MKSRIIFIVLCVLISAKLVGQSTDSINTIKISGLKRTREVTVLREIGYIPGSKLFVNDSLKNRWIQRLQGLNLFNFVDIHQCRDTLHIHVIEELYLGFSPDGGFADRNFHSWWQQRNWSRLYFGGDLRLYNLSGLNHTVFVGILQGFNQLYSMGYEHPVNKIGNSNGFKIRVYYQENKEVGTIPQENNTLQFFKDWQNTAQKMFGIDAQLNHRINYQKSIEINTNLYNCVVSENLLLACPNYLNTTGSTNRSVNVGVGYVYDSRNLKPYPTKGIENKFQLQFGAWGNQIQNNNFAISNRGRFFYPINKNNFIAVSSVIQYRFGKLNGFNSKQLGYQMDYVRGFENYVFNGSGSILLKASWRKPIFRKILHLNSKLILNNYRKMPFELWWNFNLDGGKLIKGNLTEIQNLDDKYLFGFGSGVDMVMFYDILSRFELTRNNLGGWIFNISFRHAI